MRRSSRRLLIIGMLLAVIAAAAVYLVKRREWIQNRLIDHFVQEIAPKLPFVIDSYRLSKNLDFLEARIHREAVQVVVSGPLHVGLDRSRGGWDFEYRPEIRLEGMFSTHWIVRGSLEGETLQSLRATLTDTPVLQWKQAGLDLKSPELELSIAAGETLRAELTAAVKSGTWTEPGHDQHAASVETLRLHGTAEGGRLDVQAGAKSGELLWDSFYRELPLAETPLWIRAERFAALQDPLQITVGPPTRPHVDLTLRPSQGASWRARGLPLAPLVKWAAQNALGDWEIRHGQLDISGEAAWEGGRPRLIGTDLALRQVTLRSAKASLAAKEVAAGATYRHGRAEQSAWIEAPHLYYRHFRAGLARTEIDWNFHHARTQTALPLQIENVPLSIGAIEVALQPRIEGTTSLQLSKTPVRSLTDGFCLPPAKIPPAQVSLNFSKVEGSPDSIDPTGGAEVELFGGKIQLNDLGLYDLTTEVPELDMDGQWSGIDLEQLGRWSNFGEIKGTLEGYAHEIVFQSFLPTHYHFRVDAKPIPGKNFVEFSPESMKNVVKLFTGENLDEQIPGIAGWIMFGWPSHFFGGYDVHYAGIQVTSENGSIIVETLDDERVVQETQKHFVLYGPRFKMPLKSTQYPVIIDATAMSNFVHRVIETLKGIQAAKEGESHEDPSQVCEPPEV